MKKGIESIETTPNRVLVLIYQAALWAISAHGQQSAEVWVMHRHQQIRFDNKLALFAFRALALIPLLTQGKGFDCHVHIENSSLVHNTRTTASNTARLRES